MIRFGIVGGGGIAKKFARDIECVKTAKLVAVSARTKEKAKEYQKFYNVPFAFSSYQELAESNEVDAVYIATPHSFHYEHAILFLKNKKHVLVEKPIAVNKAQLEDMIKISKENNVLLMEAMWTRFLPSTISLMNYINSNNIGELKEAHINFGYSLINNYPKEKRLLNPRLAGGSLLDMGVYPVSFYHLINNNEIKEIKALATFTDTSVDKTTEIEITDINNAKIYLKSSIDQLLENNAKLIYENAIINVIDFSRSTKYYIDDLEFNIPYEGEGFVHQIRSFVDTINNKETENKTMTHNASLSCLETMDRVRKIINLTYPFEKNTSLK